MKPRSEAIAFRGGISIGEQQHAVPGGFQLVSQLRRFGDVVRNGDIFTTGARKYQKVSRRREVGTKESAPAHF